MGASVPRRAAAGSSRRINKRKSSYYRACRLLLCVSLFVFIVKEFLINDGDENGVFAMGVRLIEVCVVVVVELGERCDYDSRGG